MLVIPRQAAVLRMKSATVELVYNALSSTVVWRLAGTHGFAWATPQ